MFVPLSKPDLTDLEKRYVLDVLESDRLSMGSKLKQFEELFCVTLHSKYAVAMHSGTGALHVGVKALALQQGDEVITSPFSFIASSNCLVFEKVRPVFVDIEPRTLNIDPAKIEKAITSKTRAVLIVHVFGQPCAMDEIEFLCSKYGLPLLEDACEAIGAEWKGKKAGTFGRAGVFSFYPNKQITTGEGGMLVTGDPEIYHLACSLRNQGREPGSEFLEHHYIGYNYRMTEMQAALGLAQLQRLEEILRKRALAAERYRDLIAGYQVPVSTLSRAGEGKPSWFVFIVVLPERSRRAAIEGYLRDKGIQSRPYFPPIHLQKCYRELFSYREGDFPVCEKMAARTLALPFYTRITPGEQEYVIAHLKRAIEGV